MTSPVLLLPLWRLFTHLLIVLSSPGTEENPTARRFCLSKHRREEPLVWTVIPLLKPWAESYSNPPDAISHSTSAEKRSQTVVAVVAVVAVVLQVESQLHLQAVSQNILRKFALFCWVFLNVSVLAELVFQLELDPTQLAQGFPVFCEDIEVERKEKRERGVDWGRRVYPLFVCPFFRLGSTEGNFSSTECLSQPHAT